MNDKNASDSHQRSAPEVGRNEPCPCGSGKKYKRCCGVSAAPKLHAPKEPAATQGAGPGFDPNQLDPQMMMQVSQALQRLPKGQIQRLQAIMQKAMSGKDVSREAAEFEKTLPVEFQDMLRGFQLPGQLPGMPSAPAPEEPSVTNAPEGMTAEDARALVAKAAAEGKISEAEAEALLGGAAPESLPGGPGVQRDASEKKAGFSKLWRSVIGQKGSK
ncbi:MAG: hypothetical protein A2428_12840 [Bdellovibrionales bacterium RIFOXYC1_FULL_54_43]|nr:MAG: hypothetical protein A2428_12840 [Bdellovibrionales bacterium RIFOXYC1_FULL_54_43]